MLKLPRLFRRYRETTKRQPPELDGLGSRSSSAIVVEESIERVHRELSSPDVFRRTLEDDMWLATQAGVRFQEDGLMDLSCPGDDIAEISERNRQQSPLLRLPAEIRNSIFILAFGGEGNHIHVYDAALDPTSMACSSPEPSKARPSSRIRKSPQPGSRPSAAGALTNCMYTDHKECFKKLDSKSLRLLGLRGVLPWEAPQLGHSRMTLVARTCRQLYDEVALLPYMLNVFSFSPGVIGTWMKRRISAQKQVIATLFAEHLCCSPKVLRCLWGNASAHSALSRDSDVTAELFQGWTALKKIYVSRQVMASVYGRRCLCHGDLVDGLEEDMQDSIAGRICAQRVTDISWIVPAGIEVELLA